MTDRMRSILHAPLYGAGHNNISSSYEPSWNLAFTNNINLLTKFQHNNYK